MANDDALALADVPELPGDVPVVYVNSANLLSSLYDVSMDVGIIVGQADGQPLVRRSHRIVMSWSHAKVLARILDEHVSNWEERFGPIITPTRMDVVASEPEPPSSRSRSARKR